MSELNIAPGEIDPYDFVQVQRFYARVMQSSEVSLDALRFVAVCLLANIRETAWAYVSIRSSRPAARRAFVHQLLRGCALRDVRYNMSVHHDAAERMTSYIRASCSARRIFDEGSPALQTIEDAMFNLHMDVRIEDEPIYIGVGEPLNDSRELCFIAHSFHGNRAQNTTR